MLIHSPKELALLVINQRKKLNLSQAEVADSVGLKQKTIKVESKPSYLVFRVREEGALQLNASHFCCRL